MFCNGFFLFYLGFVKAYGSGWVVVSCDFGGGGGDFLAGFTVVDF